MSGRRGIATLVLLVFFGLPVGGTVCAMICNAPPTQASHHGSGHECDESAPRSSGPLIAAWLQHDCSTHGGAIRTAAGTAPQRADVNATPAPTASETSRTELAIQADTGTPSNSAVPPGTGPPTKTPFVLRV